MHCYNTSAGIYKKRKSYALPFGVKKIPKDNIIENKEIDKIVNTWIPIPLIVMDITRPSKLVLEIENKEKEILELTYTEEELVPDNPDFYTLKKHKEIHQLFHSL